MYKSGKVNPDVIKITLKVTILPLIDVGLVSAKYTGTTIDAAPIPS